jgi:Glycosyl hydrolase family 12
MAAGLPGRAIDTGLTPLPRSDAPRSLVPEVRSIGLVPSPHLYSVVASPSAPAPTRVTAGDAFVYPGLYNAAPGGSGSIVVSQTRTSGPLQASVNFSHIVAEHGGVVGFPEIQYGAKPWCAGAPCPRPPISPALTLPVRLSALPPLWASVTYSMLSPTPGPSTPFDLAFDLWLTRGPDQSSAGRGDVEVMGWLYYSSSSLLPGIPIGTLSLDTSPASSVGHTQWAVYVQHGARSDDPSQWTIVYLVLETPSPNSSLNVDLGALLRGAEAALSTSFPADWNEDGRGDAENPAALYLDDIELGSEFLPMSSGATGGARYSWGLSAYSLSTDVPEAAGTPAAPGESGRVPLDVGARIPPVAVLLLAVSSAVLLSAQWVPSSKGRTWRSEVQPESRSSTARRERRTPADGSRVRDLRFRLER